MKQRNEQKQHQSILNRRKIEGGSLYVLLTVLGVGSILLGAILSNGAAFRTVFHFDLRDTGMDFFNSLAETRGAVPYTAYETLYPPLANLMFYLLQLCVPNSVSAEWADDHMEIVAMRGTDLDLRTHQAPTILFLVYLVVVTILMIEAMEQALGSETSRARLIAIASVFCYGNLFAMERGNIITLSFVFSLFFVANYNSESAIRREAALISLAVSAGLKMYPALLGILLLDERQWKRAIRTICYGVLIFVGPFFFFEGIDAIKIFLSVLLDFEQGGAKSLGGYGINSAVATFFEVIYRITGISFGPLEFLTMATKVTVGIILVFCYRFCDKSWEKHLILTFALVLYQKALNYTLIFFLLPFVMFLKENKFVTRTNWVYYLFFMIVLIPMATPMITPWHSLHSALVLVVMLGTLLWFTWNKLLFLVTKNRANKAT